MRSAEVSAEKAHRGSPRAIYEITETAASASAQRGARERGKKTPGEGQAESQMSSRRRLRNSPRHAEDNTEKIIPRRSRCWKSN